VGFGMAETEDVAEGRFWERVCELVRLLIGGSLGASRAGAPSSEWSPTGFRGRRRVPLLGCGSIPRESQIMLYTSIFSVGRLD
jgi:hypothetical protein